MTYKKKLIEVALPLAKINEESARSQFAMVIHRHFTSGGRAGRSLQPGRFCGLPS